MSDIPTTLKELSSDPLENAENGRVTVIITDRSAHKIDLKSMVTLIKTAHKRAYIDINGWEISTEKLIRDGYKIDDDHPGYIEVPELLSIIEVERYDVLNRLLRCGAYSFSVNANGLSMLAALSKNKRFDILQYVSGCLPYCHVERLLKMMRIESKNTLEIS